MYTTGESRDSNPVVASLSLPRQEKDGDESSPDSPVNPQSAVTPSTEGSSTLQPPQTQAAAGHHGDNGDDDDAQLENGEAKIEGMGTLDEHTAASTDESPAARDDTGLDSETPSRQNQRPTVTIERASVLDTTEERSPNTGSSVTQLPVGGKLYELGDTSRITRAGVDETLAASLETDLLANESDHSSKDWLERSDASDAKKGDVKLGDDDCGTEGSGNQVSAIGTVLKPTLDADVTQEGTRTNEPTSFARTSPKHIGMSAGTAVEIPEEPAVTVSAATLADATTTTTDSASRDSRVQSDSAETVTPPSRCKQAVADQAKAATTGSITSSSAATTAKEADEMLGSIEDMLLPGRETLFGEGDDQRPRHFDPLLGNSRTEGMGNEAVGSNPNTQGGGMLLGQTIRPQLTYSNCLRGNKTRGLSSVKW